MLQYVLSRKKLPLYIVGEFCPITILKTVNSFFSSIIDMLMMLDEICAVISCGSGYHGSLLAVRNRCRAFRDLELVLDSRKCCLIRLVMSTPFGPYYVRSPASILISCGYVLASFNPPGNRDAISSCYPYIDSPLIS